MATLQAAEAARDHALKHLGADAAARACMRPAVRLRSALPGAASHQWISQSLTTPLTQTLHMSSTTGKRAREVAAHDLGLPSADDKAVRCALRLLSDDEAARVLSPLPRLLRAALRLRIQPTRRWGSNQRAWIATLAPADTDGAAANTADAGGGGATLRHAVPSPDALDWSMELRVLREVVMRWAAGAAPPGQRDLTQALNAPFRSLVTAFNRLCSERTLCEVRELKQGRSTLRTLLPTAALKRAFAASGWDARGYGGCVPLSRLPAPSLPACLPTLTHPVPLQQPQVRVG